MTVVVGIDPSLTITGCARVDLGVGADGQTEAVRWETWRGRASRPDVETPMTNRRRIRTMLREVLSIMPPSFDLAVVEGPAMGAKYTPLADERSGLRWMLIDQLAARGPVVIVSPTSRQVLAHSDPIPRGTTPARRKALVLESVRELVPDAHIPDHNVADSVALAAAGAVALGAVVVDYTQKQRIAHSKIAWPGAVAS